jgi:hypothetical protein
LATLESFNAPLQVKVARAQVGTQVNFGTSRADGSVGGRYEDHLLACIIVDSETVDVGEHVAFDELPDVEILEFYLMKSSDILSSFQPYTYAEGTHCGQFNNTYEHFRYVVGRDSPEKLQELMHSFKENIRMVSLKRGWTREDCFFGVGPESPNSNVDFNKHKELRGMMSLRDAMNPFELRSPLRHNETVDVVLVHDSVKIRVSLKTATYAKYTGKEGYSGFFFNRRSAPNWHHCDVVIAVRFNVQDTQAVAATVFTVQEVYDTGKFKICWHKTGRRETTFDLTSEEGKLSLRKHVETFAGKNEENK